MDGAVNPLRCPISEKIISLSDMNALIMSSNLLEAYRRISTNWLRYVIFAFWYLYMRLDLLHELAESGHSICD